jgi:hypothetical protein
MLRWLVSIVEQIWGIVLMKAQYWTALGAMALPLGVSLVALSIVLTDRKSGLIIAGFGSMILGFIFSLVGWKYTIKEDQRRDSKDTEEKQQRVIDDTKNQQEHDEIIALLIGAGLGKGMSSPRLINIIKRIRELGDKNNE